MRHLHGGVLEGVLGDGVCVVVLGLGPNPSCCLRCFGRGSLAVYLWVLGLAVEEVIFFTCCKYEM